MRVTVLVPIYGVERYITECAASLLSQTYADIEYVFCDDATPDASLARLRETVARFPERAASVRIIANERNSGLGATRARLLDEVRTPLFTIVDSDDRLPPDAIAALVRRQRETGADIVEGAYSPFTANGLRGRVRPSHAHGRAYLNRVLCQNIIANRVWGKLYRTEAARRVPGLFVAGIDFAEDLAATLRLAAVTTRAWTDAVVYHYRTDNAASYTTNITPARLRQYLRASQTVLSFYHRRGHLPLSLEIGLLNAYRLCRRYGLPRAEADNIMRYVPEHITASLLLRLLTGGTVSNAVGEIVYRTTRWITARL